MMEMVGVVVVVMTVVVINCAGVAHDGCGHGDMEVGVGSGGASD